MEGIRLKPMLPGLAGLALFVLVSAYGYHLLKAVVADTEARKQARETLLRAEKALSLLKDVEAGQRGYLLTGDGAFLVPYEDARARLDDALATLRQGLEENPADGGRFEALQGLITRQVAIAAAGLGHGAGAGRPPMSAEARAGLEEGKAVMDRIRTGFDALESTQRQRIQALDQGVLALQDRARWVAYGVAGLAGGLLLLAYGLLRREQGRRLQAEQARGAARIAETRALAEAESQRHIAAILESLVDGFIALDRDWRFTYVNTQASRLLGRPPASLVGRRIWAEFPEGEDQPFAQAYRRVMDSRRAESLEAYYVPWSRWFENRIYPTPEGIAIYFHEITDRRLSEAALRQARDDLRALARRQDQDMENERRRLSREVHDQLGQIFTALKLNLLARPLGAPLEPEQLSEFEQLLDQGIHVARRIAADLRPSMLDDLGLGPALEQYARLLGDQAGFSVQVEVAADARLTPEQSNQLFRIAQEALTNVARHARAGRVRIRGGADDGHYVLSVEDDGPGRAAGMAGGLGMLGMRERAEQMGAELSLEASELGGLRVRVNLPLIEEEA